MKRLLVACLLCVACTATSEDPTDTRPQRLAYLGPVSQRSITVPDTVRAFAPLTITVYAWGSGTRACNEPAGAHVTQSNDIVRIEALVRVADGTIGCTRDLRAYPIEVSARLLTEGRVTIRVIGTASSSDITPDSIDRVITVIR